MDVITNSGRSGGRLVSLASIGIAGLALLVSGCSGGAAGNQGIGGAEREQRFASGGLVTRAVGTAQEPVLSSSRWASVVGLGGASFTEIVQSTTGAVVNSLPASNKIAFLRDGDIYQMDFDGKNVKPLTSTAPDEQDFDWSPDGKQIAYELLGDLWVMNANGTGARKILDNGRQPAWLRQGNRIVFERSGDLFIGTLDATGLTSLVNLTNSSISEDAPDLSPKADKIAFIRGGDVFTADINVNTNALSNVSPLVTTSASEDHPQWSPDGLQVAFYRSGGHIVTIKADKTGEFTVTGPSAPSDAAGGHRPTWSPNGSRIAFTRVGSSMDIVSVDSATGQNLTNLSGGSTKNDYHPDWSPIVGNAAPPPSNRKLIGSGGAMGASCAGLLFGQLDKTVTSVVTFDTADTTVAGRSVSRVDAMTSVDTGGLNLIFSIKAGGGTLSSLKYTNGSDPVASVLPSATSKAVGAIVTFSATEGTLTTVLPYEASRGSAPSATRVGNAIEISGRFSGVWNASGKNVAPRGASRVRIDAGTGALLNAQ